MSRKIIGFDISLDPDAIRVLEKDYRTRSDQSQYQLYLIVFWRQKEIYVEARKFPHYTGDINIESTGFITSYKLPRDVDADLLEGWVIDNLVARLKVLCNVCVAEYDGEFWFLEFPGKERERIEFETFMYRNESIPQKKN